MDEQTNRMGFPDLLICVDQMLKEVRFGPYITLDFIVPGYFVSIRVIEPGKIRMEIEVLSKENTHVKR